MTYFARLFRALFALDEDILLQIQAQNEELIKMSEQSDRFQASLTKLQATIDNQVIPALEGGSSAGAASDALFSSAADALDAADSKLTAAVPPAPAAAGTAPVPGPGQHIDASGVLVDDATGLPVAGQ